MGLPASDLAVNPSSPSGQSSTGRRRAALSPSDFPERGRQTFRNSHPSFDFVLNNALTLWFLRAFLCRMLCHKLFDFAPECPILCIEVNNTLRNVKSWFGFRVLRGLWRCRGRRLRRHGRRRLPTQVPRDNERGQPQPPDRDPFLAEAHNAKSFAVPKPAMNRLSLFKMRVL